VDNPDVKIEKAMRDIFVQNPSNISQSALMRKNSTKHGGFEAVFL
jgi:hypothetical protein